MRCHHIFVLVQVLEHHHGLARQGGAIEGIGQFHGSLRSGGCKLQLCGDLLLIDQQRLAGCLVHKNTAQFVGLAHLQVFVGDRIHQGDLPGRLGNVFSIHRSRGADLRNTFELVIDGAQVDGGIVSRNRNVWHLHQLVPLVALAGQFLQGVLVEGQGAQLILHIHHPSLGGQAEPGAGVVIPQGFIGDFIVAVGILRVEIPLGGGSHLAVLVRHHNVAFTRGLAGEFKGHVGKPVHIGFSALAHLDKLQVATDDLVIGSVAVPELDDLPILPNLERAHGLVGVEVSLAGLAFHHLVGAIRQGPVLGLGDAVHHLDGSAHLTGGVESTVDVHSVLRFVCDFKESPVQAGPAQGSEQPRLQVAFLNEHATSNDFIGHGEFIDYPISFHQDGLVGSRHQHGLVGSRLVQDVLAVGQQVIRRTGLALRVGD